MKEKKEKGRAKRRYHAPKIRTEKVYERQSLACDKNMPGMGCDASPLNS